MDNDNIQDLNSLKPKEECRAKVELLGSYDPSGEIIRDPYYVCYHSTTYRIISKQKGNVKLFLIFAGYW